MIQQIVIKHVATCINKPQDDVIEAICWKTNSWHYKLLTGGAIQQVLQTAY